MDDIFKEMEERANDLACNCSDSSPICNACRVSVDQARLITVLRMAINDMQETEDLFDDDGHMEMVLDDINKILRGDCDK